MDEAAPPGNYLKEIGVNSLFGEYNYRLGFDSLFHDPRVLILYGQNGSGKTTILKIVRSLLASDDNAGLRTWLSRVPFSKVFVELSDGVVVEAVRKDESPAPGAYKWSLKRRGVEVQSMTIRPRNGRVSGEDWDEGQRQKYEAFRSELLSVLPQVIYLDDKRTFFEQGKSVREPRFVDHRMSDGRLRRVMVPDDMDEEDPVALSLRELAHAVRREALLLSNRGSEGAQSIYTSLIERIGSSLRRNDSFVSNSRGQLIERLNREQDRSRALSKYGLVASVDHSDMLRVIEGFNDNDVTVLLNILEPYVESLSARFDALEALHQAIDRWVTNVDDFLSPKRVAFRVGDEVQVFSKSGNPLSAGVLSSGERHLLFLLTKALLMRNSGGLLLIDEPELSLNVSWQRRLINAILAGFGGSPGQVLVASHSLEIAAQFEANVMEMVE